MVSNSSCPQAHREFYDLIFRDNVFVNGIFCIRFSWIRKPDYFLVFVCIACQVYCKIANA